MKKKKKKQPCVLSKTNFSSWSFRSLPFLMVSLYSFPWFFFSSIYWIILHPLNISFWGNLLVFLNTWPNHPLARLSSFPQQVIFPLFLNHIHFFILSKSSVHVIKIQQSFLRYPLITQHNPPLPLRLGTGYVIIGNKAQHKQT